MLSALKAQNKTNLRVQHTFLSEECFSALLEGWWLRFSAAVAGSPPGLLAMPCEYRFIVSFFGQVL